MSASMSFRLMSTSLYGFSAYVDGQLSTTAPKLLYSSFGLMGGRFIFGQRRFQINRVWIIQKAGFSQPKEVSIKGKNRGKLEKQCATGREALIKKKAILKRVTWRPQEWPCLLVLERSGNINWLQETSSLNETDHVCFQQMRKKCCRASRYK